MKSLTKKRLRVDTAASILCRLNERCYRVSLMKDANNVNQRLVLPMALAWKHETSPLTKNIPFDIDEMPDVLAAGESGHVPFNPTPSDLDKTESKSKHTITTSSPDARLVAQRSSDPGMIDLAFVSQYVDETELGYCSECNIYSIHSGSRHAGEISLDGFEVEKRLQSRMRNRAKTSIRRKTLSVRVNSASSKATILPSNQDGYLAAKLPAEVQDGRFLSIKRAKAIANRLGTYDCRHGLPPTNPTGKNANRVTVGRTRIMWTSKSPPDKPQRVFFTSLLTGKKLDSGAQRRPRDVRLVIKVDGEYFTHESTPQSSPPGETTSGCITQYLRPKKQFVIDPSKYIGMLLLREGNGTVNDVATYQETNNEKPEAKFQEPQLECLPDNSGVISVTCAFSGSINISSIHDALNSAARRKWLHCTVCWAAGSSALGEVKACSVCGLLAHLQCCIDPGESSHTSKGGVISTEWTCAVCCQGRKLCRSDPHSPSCRTAENRRSSRPPHWLTESHVFQNQLIDIKPKLCDTALSQSASPYEQKCILCPYSGGAMSQIVFGDSKCWVHEVCRIWTDVASVARTEPSGECLTGAVCALCGIDEAVRCRQHLFQTNDKLVKCAASNCSVRFHPICAFLVSKLQDQSKTKSEEDYSRTDFQARLRQDSFVTKHCTLSMMHYEATGLPVENKYDKLPNHIPICFCSFHHPCRDATLYGLYPGGANIDQEAVLIPSLPMAS